MIKQFIQKYALISSISIFLPIVTFAQETVTNNAICSGTGIGFNMHDLRTILNSFTCLLLNSVVPLLMALALVVFIYGVITYMINANDQTKREEGRRFMIWGIIALFVITSVWGLVKLLASTFGIGFALPQLMQ
jgi:hypothetical protein